MWITCPLSHQWRTRVLVAAIAWVTIVGCGLGSAKTYPVAGKVVFEDDRPVTGGAVRFESVAEPKTVAWGEIQRDGTFSLTTRKEGDGAIAGDHVALIEPPTGDETKALVHPRFQSYDTSGLKFTVQPDDNYFIIKVERLRRR